MLQYAPKRLAMGKKNSPQQKIQRSASQKRPKRMRWIESAKLHKIDNCPGKGNRTDQADQRKSQLSKKIEHWVFRIIRVYLAYILIVINLRRSSQIYNHNLGIFKYLEM